MADEKRKKSFLEEFDEKYLTPEQKKALDYNWVYENPADVGPPVEVAPTIGGLERFGRNVAAGLASSGAFLQESVVDPLANVIESAEASLVGRDPRYRNRAEQNAQAIANLRLPEGYEYEPGVVNTALGITGDIGGMLPEMLIPGAGIKRADTALDALKALDAVAEASKARKLAEATRQGLRQELPTALAASSITAPRLGTQTEREALAAGASPEQARVAGVVDMLGTMGTNVLPVSAAGGLASRSLQGAGSNVVADLTQQNLTNLLLPDELRKQREEQMLSAENLFTQTGVGAALGGVFGVKVDEVRQTANALQAERIRDLAAKDLEIAKGAAAAQQMEAVRKAELAIAELNNLTEKALNRKEGTSPLFGESVYPTVEPEKAPVQEAIAFPERAPLQRDIFGNEVEARPVTPEAETEVRARDLTQQAAKARDEIVSIDDRIDQLLEEKTRIVPTGPRGGYARKDRVTIDRIDRQIIDLQQRKQETQRGITNLEAEATSARLDTPEVSTRSEQDVRRDYLLTMQGRQYDQAERAALGEAEAQGQGATPDLFQPTKPRVRAELEPEQGDLGLPKPRIRIPLEPEATAPAPTPTPAPRPPVQEGPTGQLDLRAQPKGGRKERIDLSPEAEQATRLKERTQQAENVYKSDVKQAKQELTQARTELTNLQKNGEVVPEPLMARVETAQSRVREAELNLERFQKAVKATQPQPAATPKGTTRRERVEARGAASVEATPAPAVRTVAEQEVDPVTGQLVSTVSEAISPASRERQEIEGFFSQPKTPEQLTSPEDASAVTQATTARAVPMESRQPTRVEQALSRAANAEDAMRIISSAIKPESSYRRVADALLRSPFLKDTNFRIIQPEDTLTGGIGEAFARPAVRGAMLKEAGQPNTVYIKGAGYEVNGVGSLETALHEIVHAATSDLLDGVSRGRITDPETIRLAKEVEKIRFSMENSINNDPNILKSLSPEERSRVKYAIKNTDEFVSVALSSPAFQTAMKKEGLWARFVELLRKLHLIPRADKSVFEQILDAGLAVVEAQTKGEATVREARSRTDKAILESRAERQEVDAFEPEVGGSPTKTAVEQALGADTTLRQRAIQSKWVTSKMSPYSKAGRAVRKVNYALDRLFSSTRGSTRSVREARGRAQGTIERMSAEMSPFVNNLRLLVDSFPKGQKAEASEVVNKALMGKATDQDWAKIGEYQDRTKEVVKQVRTTIDKFTQEIGAEILEGYRGRDMPRDTLNLLKTLKENIGSYVARTYTSDMDPSFAGDLWTRYEKGDTDAVEIVQPLVDRMSSEIGGLPKFLSEARQEAEALSQNGVDFLAQDTVVGAELRRLYENFIGSSAGRTKEDMFSGLESFSEQSKDIRKEAERIVQQIMGLGDAKTQLAQYFRGLRSSDQPLRKRSAVPADIRRVWGEIQDPILNAINTSQRMARLMSGLKASNMLSETAPELFAERFDSNTGQTLQIPNNPIAYGQLAGKYTDEGTYNLVVGQTELAATLLYGKPVDAKKGGAWLGSGIATLISKLTAFQKMTSIVMNPFVALSNIFNVAYMPLVNGNTNPATLAKAASVATQMVGTGYRRKDADPLMLEILDAGIIDPVLTQAQEIVTQRKREAQAYRRQNVLSGGYQRAKSRAFVAGDTGKEIISYLETLPKIANYLYHKEEYKKIFPELSQQEINRLAAEETNRLNLTYSRVPDVVRLTETFGVSYVAGYMQQIMATSIYSVTSGARQAAEGIRSGNSRLAIHGLKKLGGSVAAFTMASYIPEVVASMYDLVDLGEDDEEKQAVHDTLPFLERGMQPVLTNINSEGVATYTDLGRLNPYDSFHSVIRATAQASGAVARGDNEQAMEFLNAALNNLSGQFVGGGPIGQMAMRTIQGKDVPSAMELDAKKLHDTLRDNLDAVPGISPSTASNLLNAAWNFVPAAGRGISRAKGLEERDAEAAADPFTYWGTFLRAPVRPHDPFTNLKNSFQFNYRGAVQNGRKDLREILLSSGESIDEDQVKGVFQRMIDAEAEAFNDLNKGVIAARYLGGLANMPAEEINRRMSQSLKDGGMNQSQIRAMVRGSGVFEPTLIGDQWGEDAIATEVQGRVTGRQERVVRRKELEARLKEIQRIAREVQPRRQLGNQ